MDENAEFEQAFASLENNDSSNSSSQANSANDTTSSNDNTTQEPSGSTQNDTQVENAGSNEGNNDTSSQETKNENVVNNASKSNNVDRHQQNNINAQRRIRRREEIASLKSQNEQKDAEIERLRKKIESMEGRGELNELEKMRLESLNDQLEEADDDYNRREQTIRQAEYEEFNDRVRSEVGDAQALDAQRKIQSWASHVNKNERQLVKMVQERPYGTHLLYEWCTRMDKSPTAFQKWNSMNSYEKDRWLANVYQLVLEDHNPKNQQTNTNPQSTSVEQKPINVGVAQSGRGNTINQPAAEDDFGSALEKKMQQLGIRKF